MPPFYNLLRNLTTGPPPPTAPLDPSKNSFTALRFDMKDVACSGITTSTNDHSSLFPYSPSTTNSDSNPQPQTESTTTTYPVPKTLEESLARGLLRLLLWELGDDEIFPDSWRGWYAVWYIPKIERFYLVRLADREGEGGFMDVPKVEERDERFWFWTEMREVRSVLLNKFEL